MSRSPQTKAPQSKAQPKTAAAKAPPPQLPPEEAIELAPALLALGRRRLAFLVAMDRSLLGYLLDHGRLAASLRHDAMAAQYVIDRETRLGHSAEEAHKTAQAEVLEPRDQEGTAPGPIEQERTKQLFDRWKKTPNGKLFTAD